MITNTRPGYRLPHLDWPLGVVSAFALFICLFYAYAYAFLAPNAGLTLDESWNVISLDPCDVRAAWCESNRSRFQPGDRLLVIGDLTYENYRRDRRRVAFEGYGPGVSVPMTVIRNGDRQTTDWQMPVGPDTRRLSQLGALLFFLPFWLAGAVVWLFLRPRDRRWQLLILFSYITAIWLTVGAQSAEHIVAASLVSRAITWLLMPIYLHLHLIVPAPLSRPPHRYFLPILYGIAIILALLELFQMLPSAAYQLGLLLAIGGSLGLLVFRLFDKSSSAARLAVRLMLTGIGLAFVPGLVLWLVPTLLRLPVPGDWATNASILALPLLPLFYTYALYKRRLGALEFRANRLLSLYSFILLYLTAFALIFLTIRQLMTVSRDDALFDLAISALFIVAAPPLSARFQRLVDRLAYGTTYNPDNLIHVFADRIPTAPNREALVALLTDEVVPSLLIRQSALYLLVPGSAQLVYARGVHFDETAAALPWLQELLAEAGRYRLARAEAEAAPSREIADGPLGRTAFEWVRLVIPLEIQKKAVGVWLFGRRDPDDYYPQDDITLLSTLANQVALAVENARLFADAGRRLERLQALRSIDLTISASLDLRVTLDVFLEQVTARLQVDAADILLLNRGTQALAYAAGRGFRTRALQHTQLRLGESHAGRAALERRAIHIPDLLANAGDLTRAPLLTTEGFVAYYGLPLVTKGQVKGVLEIFHRSTLTPDAEWLDFLEALAGQAAIAIDNTLLFEGLQRSNAELALAYDTTLEGWSRALELRDQETEGHTQRVTETTLRLAQAMGVNEDDLVHIRRGALLHDIGKMGIPDGILLKPGPLTEAEWEIMRKHPVYANDMLTPILFLRRALDVPHCHHEKWDGTGYPRGLKGEQIPLSARIFAVVDVWDALRSDRPYRAAWPDEKVREHLRSLSGAHFDPQVVQAFLNLER